jgi:Ca2+-binding EF-hand superfamily protein
MRSATVLAIAQCLVIASCQAGLGGPASQPAPGRQPFIAEFKRIDAAGKGRVTMDQAVEYYRNRFRELDRNGDRFLDVSELEAAMPIMDATTAKELVLKLDRNSDGKLSEAEFTVIANWLFQLAKSPTQLTLTDVEKG